MGALCFDDPRFFFLLLVDEGKGRLDPSRDKKEFITQRRRWGMKITYKEEKSPSVYPLLCDP